VVEKNAHVLNVRNPDNAKARRVLGWAPKLDLTAGLATLIA
jgi:nucleoside-diphosphate-sugar epimerase